MNEGETAALAPRHRVLIRASLLLILGLLLGSALVVVAIYKPTDNSFYPKCVSHSLTGLHCPGCGTTRALHALLNGQLRQALTYNLLLPITFPVMIYYFASSLWHWVWGTEPRRLLPYRITSRLIWALMILMLAYGILRNLPWEPFTELAPHELTPATTPETP